MCLNPWIVCRKLSILNLRRPRSYIPIKRSDFRYIGFASLSFDAVLTARVSSVKTLARNSVRSQTIEEATAAKISV